MPKRTSDEERVLTISTKLYVASHFVPMKGTIHFERLNCGHNETYVRILLNDIVYRKCLQIM